MAGKQEEIMMRACVRCVERTRDGEVSEVVVQ